MAARRPWRGPPRGRVPAPSLRTGTSELGIPGSQTEPAQGPFGVGPESGGSGGWGKGPPRASVPVPFQPGVRLGSFPPDRSARPTLETGLLALLTDFVTGEIARYGYLAIFLLMLLESACIPIPSEVTMLFGGALVTAPFLAPEQQLEFWLVVLAGTLGNLVGSWLAYWAGYSGGRPLIDRWGRYLLIRPHEVDRAHVWFERHGQAAVFFGRLLPVIRTFISLPAGVVRMRFGRFTVYTVLGCLPWVIALTWIGALLGERWDRAEAIIRPFAWVIAGALLVGLVWFVWNRIRQIRREEAARAPSPPPDVPGRAVASPRAPDAGVSPLEGTIPTGTAERVEET
jgi:membrane protein DedA with SNARE-associated domain